MMLPAWGSPRAIRSGDTCKPVSDQPSAASKRPA
jgi:hypothetical protein